MRLFCKIVVEINTHILSDLLLLSITGANKQVKLKLLVFPGLCLITFHADKGPFVLGIGLSCYDCVKSSINGD